MGNAASLFFNTVEPKNSLDWRIRPSDEQYDAQKERWNALADYLLAQLREASDCATSSWLQGSYKFGTQIRPADKDHEFDIDLGVYFHWEGSPENGAWNPTDLKGMVQQQLETYVEFDGNDAEAVSKPKQRCNRIHFAENFHIDVPSYHLAPEQDARMLATQSDTWEFSDPKAIYEWWKNAIEDSVRARVRRLVRYLKMWAALKFEEDERPSSILLTVLTAQAYLSLAPTDHSGDDEFFFGVVEKIYDRLLESNTVPNPVNKKENLNRLSAHAVVNFTTQLESLADIASRALEAHTQAQSADLWAQVFEHFFPIPNDEEVLAESATAIVPIRFMPEIEVTATTRGQNPKSFHGMNAIGPIPKDSDIQFQLSNAYALPIGATVYWTVRNEGDEAEIENDLGHVSGTGLSASEHSAYKGRHFMDVAIKLNGVLIGRRRIPVTITGLGLPPRNPKKKPEYVKFRKKKR
ncbi:MAG: CBASS cGAMP synthase [Parvibaculum sp.]|uniref:CBASS cGAMP synthase n=1 Tax=Parvibaculum sp. TaxID=2024848 RepID=UPI0032655776